MAVSLETVRCELSYYSRKIRVHQYLITSELLLSSCIKSAISRS
jgi:hypothetical protein